MRLSLLMGPSFRKESWNIRFHYKGQIAAFTQRTQPCIEMRGVLHDYWREKKETF